MREIGWLLCAVALASCATAPPPAAKAPPPPPAAPAPEPEPPAPAVVEVPPPAPPAAPPPAPAPEPAPAPAKPPEGVLLVGTVSFPDGKTPKAVLLTLGREGIRPIVIFGKNGRFEHRVPEEGTYRLAGLIADGVNHAYLPDEIVVEAGKEVRILLEEARPAALLVVDKETGAPIPGARALRSIRPWGFGYMGEYPRFRKGETETLRADGDGRIDLGSGRGTEQLWVAAKGRAWTAVEVPHTPGGDVPVRLPPGGSLRLQVPGWSDLENASLYVEFESRASCVLPDPKPSGEILLDGLPCQTLSFEVRRGGPPTGSPPLGKGTVAIRAGEEASLTLAMRAGPPPGRAVRVRGSVNFHPSWGDPEGQIVFRGAEDSNADIQEMVDLHGTDTIGRCTFVLSTLVPGRYKVEVAQWRTEVAVPAAGGTFDFTIPEAAEVRVRVVADESGEVLRGAELSWYSKEEDVRSWSSETAKLDRKTGEFVIRFLPGPLSLNASAPGRVDRDNKDPDHESKGTPEYPIYAAGQKAEVTLRLVRAGKVKVRLLCDGAPVFEPGLSVMVVVRPEAGDHDSGYSSYSMTRKGEFYTKDDVPPGRRSITIEDEKELFEEVPEKAFDVVAGETAEVAVDLVRRAPRAEPPAVEGILRVVDEETREPIPGAAVARLVEQRGGRSWRHETLPAGPKPGEFRFKGPAGTHSFHVSAPGYVPLEGHQGEPVEFLPSPPTDHEFRLVRSGTVRVRLLCDGAPVSGNDLSVMVVVRPEGGSPYTGYTSFGLARKGNEYTKDDVLPGHRSIRIEDGKGLFEEVSETAIEVVAGKTADLEIHLVRSAPRVEPPSVEGILRVVDEETREPIPGARVARLVQARAGNSWTLEPVPAGKKPGEFLFRGPAGSHSFDVEAPGYVPLEGHDGEPLEFLLSPPTDHEFRLVRGGALLVTIRGGTLPRLHGPLRLRQDVENGWTSRTLFVEGGHARQDGLVPGKYTLEVDQGTDFEDVPPRDVEILKGETTEVVVDLVRKK